MTRFNKQFKGTKGPWHDFEPVDNGAVASIGAWLENDPEHRYLIAETYPITEERVNGKITCPIEKANRAVMVASPDMLKLLFDIIGNDDGTKEQYKMPRSLRLQIEKQISAAVGG